MGFSNRVNFPSSLNATLLFSLRAGQTFFDRSNRSSEAIHKRIDINLLHTQKKRVGLSHDVHNVALLHIGCNVVSDGWLKAEGAQKKHHVSKWNDQLSLSLRDGLPAMLDENPNERQEVESSYLFCFFNVLREETNERINLAFLALPLLERPDSSKVTEICEIQETSQSQNHGIEC